MTTLQRPQASYSRPSSPSTNKSNALVKRKSPTPPEDGPEGERVELKRAQKKKRCKVGLDRLTGPDGLKRIYEEFHRVCRYQGRGSEAKYLRNLVERYKEWGHQLYPTFEYTELLDRTYVLSKEGAMRNHVKDLREQELHRRMAEAYGVEKSENTHDDDVAPVSNADESALADEGSYTALMSDMVSAAKSTNDKDISDDALWLAMEEFDQKSAKTSTTTTDHIDLSESEEEEEFESSVVAMGPNQPVVSDEENKDSANDALASLVALDSVEQAAKN